jgi:hypothetical protein
MSGGTAQADGLMTLVVDLSTTGALKVPPLLGAWHGALVRDVNPSAVRTAVSPREYPSVLSPLWHNFAAKLCKRRPRTGDTWPWATCT